mgnify:FL=1
MNVAEKIINKIRYKALHRALDRFLETKEPIKMPNLQRVNSITIILEEKDKAVLKNIESAAKSLFKTGRCGFLILSDQMAENMLQSDLYTEVTPKDFGFMSVLKPEKYNEVHKLPFSNMIINMATKRLDMSDYLCTLPKADFRISFRQSEHIKIYDLVIENGKNADLVSNIHVLYNYLVALIGAPTNEY